MQLNNVLYAVLITLTRKQLWRSFIAKGRHNYCQPFTFGIVFSVFYIPDMYLIASLQKLTCMLPSHYGLPFFIVKAHRLSGILYMYM